MKNLLTVFAFLVSASCFGQTILENNPSGLKWNQVNTPNFRVVFPKGFDLQAMRMANTLEHIRTAESKSLGTEPRKISVILQNQSAISNGFVSAYPWRSEFYAMPSQDYNFLGTNDWLDLLASHEYRHIVQYKHANRGFNRMLYYLFGLPTMAGMAHVAAPNWFWEGDAVVTETAFTPSGRGKIPNFGLVFRSNLVEGMTFNYHKQSLGSYKHQIPDHYVFGFHMVSWLRKETNDPDVWERITARSWSVPFIPFAFSRSTRKETGMRITKLYRRMAAELSTQWRSEISKLELTDFERINERRTPAFTNYLYPQPRPDGSVLVLKEGIGDISRFVLLKDGKEKRVFTPGMMSETGMLSSTENVVVWNEFGYDPRWRVRNYSKVKAFDMEGRDKYVLSQSKVKHAGAAISPDGLSVVTVRTDNSYRHSILIFKYPSGEIVRQYPNEENAFYSMARFNEDGSKIVALRTVKNERSICIFDASSERELVALEFGNENVGHPVLHGESLLFSSPVSGIDNIYAIDLKDTSRYQLTTSKYGAYNPAVDAEAKFLYYNDHSSTGMDVARVPFDRSLWKEYQPVSSEFNLYDHLVRQEGDSLLFRTVPDNQYPVKHYSKAKHILNPFAWGVLVQTDLTRGDLGISSQDILSTTSINAGYTFDLNERTGYWRAGLSYQGWYPIIDLIFTSGDRRAEEELRTVNIVGEDRAVDTVTYKFRWKEQNISTTFRLPLQLTRSKYITNLDLAYEVGYTNVTGFTNGVNDSRFIPAEIKDGEVTRRYFLLDYQGGGSLYYNTATLAFTHMLKTSRRDIFSRWGQLLDLHYSGTPFGGDFEGGVISAKAYLFFPGLFKHHSIYGYAAHQRTTISQPADANDYLFRNTVPVPRGINDYISRYREFTSASINYTMPLWYPDIAMGPVLNVKRVRLNLFGDFAIAERQLFSNASNEFSSAGAEVKFDINVLRFYPQFDIGFRYSRGLDPSVNSYEVLIGTFNF